MAAAPQIPPRQRPTVRHVQTIRERQLANALRHAIEWIQEAVPGHDCRWYKKVLSDDPDVICGLANNLEEERY